MGDQAVTLENLDAVAKRRSDRRDFFRIMGVAALVGGGATLGTTGSSLFAQAAPVTDQDIFNFALNLEYLEANFYSFALFGTPLPTDLTGGTGTRGEATGGRQVTFTDPLVAQQALEIAQNERAHVRFLRNTLGSGAIAQPTIDVSAGPNSAFSTAARAAGLIGPGETFDPYANDENFLLGAFLFEDVGVTAYKGASPLITNKTFLEAAAGILAVEAYHASILRTNLFRKGIETPTLIDATEAISDARDSLDGPDDRDQGIRPRDDASNIAPLDADGIAFSRTTGQVLNITYLTAQRTDRGGFFPNGVNGPINTSAPSGSEL